MYARPGENQQTPLVEEIMLVRLATICLIAFASVGVYAKEWQGIVPLHSSRQDVARLLGPPKTQGKYVDSFEFGNQVVDVYYASGAPCGSGLTNSWKVLQNTVVGIIISHKSEVPLNSLVSDVNRLKYSKDEHARIAYYSDDEDGVRYTVPLDGHSSVLNVMTVDYFPSRKDDRLKCSTAESTKEEVPSYAHYGHGSAERRNAILDNFTVQLELDKQVKGLIVVHAGGRRGNDALKAARYAQSYLVGLRRVNSKRIKVKIGTPRDVFMVELYLFRANVPLP